MNGQVQTSGARYVIPARTISGSREEMMTEIDDVVRGLLGLRQLISMENVGGGLKVRGGLWRRIRLRRPYGAESANR